MFSMLFILPIEKHGLSNVLENMTGEILKKIMNNDEVKKVILKLPKFKLSEKFVLSGALQQVKLK